MIKCKQEHLEARCRERGYTLEEVMPCVVRQDLDGWVVDETHESYPRERRCLAGTELKLILSKIGMQVTPTCTCTAKARLMDEMGCQWCKDNIDAISGWLGEEASKRGMPYLPVAGKSLIRVALWRAEKKAHVPLDKGQVHK